MLAPMLGAQILSWASWHAIFLVLAGAALVIALSTGLFLRETLPERRRHAGGVLPALQSFGTILHDRSFLSYALAGGLSFAAMFAYISGSPFVLQTIHGLSPQTFGMIFGVNAFGLIAVSQLSGRLVHRVSPRRVMLAGLSLASLGGVALLVIVFFGLPLPALLIALFLVTASQGLVAPNAAALALAHHQRMAGSAAAMLGASRFVLGAAAAPLVGLAGEGSALPMVLVIAVCSCAGLILCLTAE